MSNFDRANPIPLDPPVINAEGTAIEFYHSKNDLFGDVKGMNDVTLN